MRKALLFIAALTCFFAVIGLGGCAVDKITTADLPENNGNGVVTGDNAGNDYSDNKSYTLIYVDGDTELSTTTVAAGALATAINAPEKQGYDFIGWTIDGKPFDFTTPIKTDLTLSANYVPIIYTAVFKVNDHIIESVIYSVEDKDFNFPAVPEKYGYDGEWEEVELCGNVVINAIYTPTVYHAKFVVNERIVGVTDFTIEDKYLTVPDIPSMPYYSAAWENYYISARDITINAVYTPITYYITFTDGNLQTTVTYTVLNNEIVEPEPTEKEGYTVCWQPYSIDYNNATVEAVYSPIDYSLTFVANGQIVDSTTFNVETINSVKIPQIPQRPGFICNWQDFELGLKDTVVYAEYTMTFKDEFTYSLSKDKTYYTVTGYSGKENYLVIPSEHNGIPVKNIGEYAFAACTSLTSADICNGVEVIEEGAFLACTSLKTILLPESLTTISNDAFADSGVTEITIPENVTRIGENAFCDCNSLTKLAIKGSAEIGEYAFSKCQSLKYVDFGDKVVKIGIKAFYNCTSIEEIYIPAGVKEIGASAFYGCSRLRLVEFENCSGWSIVSGNTTLKIYEDKLTDVHSATKHLTVIHVTNRWICS